MEGQRLLPLPKAWRAKPAMPPQTLGPDVCLARTRIAFLCPYSLYPLCPLCFKPTLALRLCGSLYKPLRYFVFSDIYGFPILEPPPQSVACEARHAPSGPRAGRVPCAHARPAPRRLPLSLLFVSFMSLVISKYTGSPSLCSSVHPSVPLCVLNLPRPSNPCRARVFVENITVRARFAEN